MLFCSRNSSTFHHSLLYLLGCSKQRSASGCCWAQVSISTPVGMLKALLICVSTMDYAIGPGLDRLQTQETQSLLFLSLAANLGLLVYFKYSISSSSSSTRRLPPIAARSAKILIPIGISLTFEAINYTVDVYLRVPAEPIWRTSCCSLRFSRTWSPGPSFAPRFLCRDWRVKYWDWAASSLSSALLDGSVQKRPLPTAWLCSPIRYSIIRRTTTRTPSGWPCWFAIQIYCDFWLHRHGWASPTCSATSLENFNMPYIATNVSDFGIAGTSRFPPGCATCSFRWAAAAAPPTRRTAT